MQEENGSGCSGIYVLGDQQQGTRKRLDLGPALVAGFLGSHGHMEGNLQATWRIGLELDGAASASYTPVP